MNDTNSEKSSSYLSEKAQKYGKQVKGDVRDIGEYSLLALLVGLIFASFMAGCWAGCGILAIVALACYVIGSLLGFLFSIPKSAQNSEIMQKNGMNTTTFIPKDNTNLEQISDWLVKILIGASLVQLSTIVSSLQRVAEKLSYCLLTAKAHAIGIVTISSGSVIVIDAYCQPFCLFLMLYFLALGFLTGYLITRLWLPYTILISGLAMQSTQNEADHQFSKMKEDMTSLTEAVSALRLANDMDKNSTDFDSMSRLAFKKAEIARKESPADRVLGILYGRLALKVKGYEDAIKTLDAFISNWEELHKPHNFDFAALLFNRACYKNRKAEELLNSQEAEKFKISAWEDLKKSCEYDPDNKSELGDADLQSIFNDSMRKRETL